MKGRVAVAVFVLAAAAAEAGPGSVFEQGLRIEQREVVVHRGSFVYAVVHWDRGEDDDLVGDFLLRWQLRAGDGEILYEGRRTLNAPSPAGDPLRFRVRARVPRRTDAYQTPTLEVGVVSNAGIVTAASARIWTQPGRFVVLPGRSPVVLEGILETHPWRGPVLRAEVEGVERLVTLAGPGMAAVLRHPDPIGERIRVEGMEAGDSGVYIPEALPYIVKALSVEWLDDPPERLLPLERRPWGANTVPIPDGAYADLEALRAIVGTSQTPRVAETQEEYDALRTEFNVPAFWAPDIDFLDSRVVLVTAGNSGDTSFSTSVGEAWFIPRTGRTVVRYDAIRHPGGAFFVETRPYEVVVLPRRPGEVIFRRREWVGRPWDGWPRTLPE